jgi:hypothetical protein
MTECITLVLILLALVGAIVAGGINHNQVRDFYSFGGRP